MRPTGHRLVLQLPRLRTRIAKIFDLLGKPGSHDIRGSRIIVVRILAHVGSVEMRKWLAGDAKPHADVVEALLQRFESHDGTQLIEAGAERTWWIVACVDKEAQWLDTLLD